MKAALVAVSLLMPPSVALAWEAKAAGVEKRLLQRPSPAGARQKFKPGWARKIKKPEDKVSWPETYKGKTYLFGVGLVRNIDNPGLRVTAAQDRARASLLGEKTSGELEGSQLLDWYLTRAGDMYALAVLIH